MENQSEFVGSSLAMTFLVRALLGTLVDKKILSEEDSADTLDRALIALERQQNFDVANNTEVWRIAREFLEYLMSTVAITEVVRADHE